MGLEFSKCCRTQLEARAKTKKGSANPNVRPASGEAPCKAPSPPEAAMARTELKTGHTRGPTKTEGDPYQKSIEEFIALPILFLSWMVFCFGVVSD